jgi:hypothetical protein
LARNNLRLPFRIEGDPKNRSALTAQELQNRQRSARGFIAGSESFDDHGWRCFAFGTFAGHGWLLLGALEGAVRKTEDRETLGAAMLHLIMRLLKRGFQPSGRRRRCTHPTMPEQTT